MSRAALLSRCALGLAVALSCVAGCAGGSTRSTTPTAEEGGAAPMDQVFECRLDRVTLEEEATDSSVDAPVEAELDTARAPATPSSTSGGEPSPAPEARSEMSDVGGLYATQQAGLGALGCALDASDCVSAAQLGDEICRLAERVCDVDDDDARCDEARSRCLRARTRIQASCGPTQKLTSTFVVVVVAL